MFVDLYSITILLNFLCWSWILLALPQTPLALPQTSLALPHFTFIEIMHPLYRGVRYLFIQGRIKLEWKVHAVHGDRLIANFVETWVVFVNIALCTQTSRLDCRHRVRYFICCVLGRGCFYIIKKIYNCMFES